jgi:hypothetical protein
MAARTGAIHAVSWRQIDTRTTAAQPRTTPALNPARPKTVALTKPQRVGASEVFPRGNTPESLAQRWRQGPGQLRVTEAVPALDREPQTAERRLRPTDFPSFFRIRSVMPQEGKASVDLDPTPVFIE